MPTPAGAVVDEVLGDVPERASPACPSLGKALVVKAKTGSRRCLVERSGFGHQLRAADHLQRQLAALVVQRLESVRGGNPSSYKLGQHCRAAALVLTAARYWTRLIFCSVMMVSSSFPRSNPNVRSNIISRVKTKAGPHALQRAPIGKPRLGHCSGRPLDSAIIVAAAAPLAYLYPPTHDAITSPCQKISRSLWRTDFNWVVRLRLLDSALAEDRQK